MKKGLYALSLGTFCLGMSEFVMMSILPDVAKDFGVSISQAGNLISAYALGVCVGAPFTVMVARNLPLRTLLLSFMAIMAMGSIMMAFSPNYYVAICARFISGLPHGSYFGVGVIVANRLAKEGKELSAISTMVMGMTFANLVGIPIGNWIGHILSWRLIFIFNALFGILTFMSIRKLVPYMTSLPRTNLKGQFRFLKHIEPWLLIFATLLANGGTFCWYSYITPLMTCFSGIDVGLMPMLMLMSGASMCLGNYMGGHFGDKYKPGVVAACVQGTLFLALIGVFFLAQYAIASVLLMCICTCCLFAVSPPQQQLIMKYSPGSEMMGGALVQIAFNLGNAIGAFAGGVSISTGHPIQNIALIGAGFVIFGFLMFLIFNKREA